MKSCRRSDASSHWRQ